MEPAPEIIEAQTAIDERVTSAQEIANQLRIEDDEDYEAAGKFLKVFYELEKDCEAFWKPLVSTARAAWQAVLDKKKEQLEPITAAKGIVSRKLGAYASEVERQRKADEAAERKRAAAEARAANEETARQMEESGSEDAAEAADAVRSQADNVAHQASNQVHVPTYTPKAKGVAIRENWKFEVEDEALIPRQFMCADEKAIGAFVRAKKDKAEIEGVRIWSINKAGLTR